MARACAGLAFTGQADARAVLDATRMLTFKVLSRRIRPWPAQARQGLSITWPAPWQVWQVRSTVKKPCWARSRPRPGRCTLLRLGAGLRAAAMAGLAGHRARHAHRGFGAGVGLLQRDLEVEAQVLAAHVGPAAATALPPGAEHLLEDVARNRAEIEAWPPGIRRPAGAMPPSKAAGP